MARKISSDKVRKHVARKSRVTKRVKQSDRVALTVYRSNKHIYAQLVDPKSGKTIASASTRSKEVLGDVASSSGVEAAKKVGSAIAERARGKEINEVVFNRNGFLFHGRVKALAEAAREAGLKF